MSPSKPSARVSAAQRLPKRSQSSRLADERLQCLVDLAADFYWEQDEDYRFTVYRPSGEPDADRVQLEEGQPDERRRHEEIRRGQAGRRAPRGLAVRLRCFDVFVRISIS